MNFIKSMTGPVLVGISMAIVLEYFVGNVDRVSADTAESIVIAASCITFFIAYLDGRLSK